MQEETNYWTKKRLSRRQALRGGLALGAGVVGLSIGCSSGTPTSPTPAATIPSVAPTAAPSPTAGKPKPTGKLTVATGGFYSELFNPPEVMGGGDVVYLNLPFETLVMRDLQGKLAPGLAKSWSTPDGQTWDFELQKGVKFHNGDTMTAKDVKFSLDRTKTAKGPQSVLVSQVMDTVEILDDYKVRVKLKKKMAPWLTAVEVGVYVMPKDYFEKLGPDEFAKKPVGTGPYRYVNWKMNESMEFEAVEDHWRQVPSVKNVVLRIVPDVSTRVAMLRAREADIAVGVPPNMRKEIESDNGLRLAINKNLGFSWGWFLGASKKDGDKYVVNTGDPWADKRVRQAANYAINREQMAEKLLQGQGSPAVTLALPMDFGFNPSLKPYAYDPTKAKALLKEAGYANGFSTDIYATTNADLAQAIGGFLGAVGIQANVKTMETATYFDKVIARQIGGIGLVGGGSGGIARYDAWRPLFQYNKTGTWSMMADPDMDKMIDAIEEEPDEKKREDLTRKALAKEYEDSQHLFLLYNHAIHGANDKVLDWPQQAGFGIFKWAELIKMKV